MSQQILWLNSYIKVNNKVLCNVAAWNAGLIAVGDLCDGNTFLSFEQVEHKFGTVLNWFEHQQLISAIPNIWKQKIHLEGSCIIFRGTLIRTRYSAREVYTKMILNGNANDIKCLRWQEKLNCTIEIEDFYKLFENIYKLTVATKY